MAETVQTPSDAASAVSSARIAHEVRGAAKLVLAGTAVRVVLCGLGGREAAEAMAGAVDLTGIVPIRIEHDAPDTYALIVGPLPA